MPGADSAVDAPLLSVIVIGRNEGERLSACLTSVRAINDIGGGVELIYVDSASCDDSVPRARALGARVLVVQPARPCAAVGRNAGLRVARGRFVLFLDGDTQVHPAFAREALARMRDPSVAVVWGHRRELRPQDSIYNRVLDLDWVFPPGETPYCGGDAMMRASALQASGPFDETLIAGEEPELCRRIRAAGFRILHIDRPMTVHDLAIHRFAQYWRRAFRSGHAFAEVACRFRSSADPLWAAESRRNLLHAGTLGAVPALAAVATGAGAGVAPLAISGLAAATLVARSALRCRWKGGSLATRFAYAAHSHLQQIPIAAGQLAFHLDRLRGRRRGLVEYKAATHKVPTP